MFIAQSSILGAVLISNNLMSVLTKKVPLHTGLIGLCIIIFGIGIAIALYFIGRKNLKIAL